MVVMVVVVVVVVRDGGVHAVTFCGLRCKADFVPDFFCFATTPELPS